MSERGRDSLGHGVKTPYPENYTPIPDCLPQKVMVGAGQPWATTGNKKPRKPLGAGVFRQRKVLLTNVLVGGTGIEPVTPAV